MQNLREFCVKLDLPADHIPQISRTTISDVVACLRNNLVTSQIVLFDALHVEDPSVRFTPESGHWAKLAQKGR